MSDKAVKIAQAPIEDHSHLGKDVPQNGKTHDCAPQTVTEAAGNAIKKDVKESDKGVGQFAKNTAVEVADMGLSFFGLSGLGTALSAANTVRQAAPVVTGTIDRATSRDCEGENHGSLPSPTFPQGLTSKVAAR